MPELPERYNASQLLDRNLEAGREARTAIHWAGGEVSYGELFKLACGAGRTLRDLGVRREQRVLIIADDSPGWAAALLGALRFCAISVLVNSPLQRSEEYNCYVEY